MKPTVTSGDRLPDRLPPEIGGRGVFTEELERNLQIGEINLAVHSLKDLPIDDTPDLVIGAIASRDDGQCVLRSCGPIRTVIGPAGQEGTLGITAALTLHRNFRWPEGMGRPNCIHSDETTAE
jgi:hydroxymethylbilane synthase